MLELLSVLSKFSFETRILLLALLAGLQNRIHCKRLPRNDCDLGSCRLLKTCLCHGHSISTDRKQIDVVETPTGGDR